MKKRFSLLVLTAACFMPLIWRLLLHGVTEPIGLLSDFSLGLLVLLLALLAPHWLRIIVVLLWALFQAGAQELFAAMQRFPSWQDMHYLADPTFMENSTAGLQLSSPYLVGLILVATLLTALLPVARPRAKQLGMILVAAGALLLLQGVCSRHYDDQSIAARYNPLHWFVSDALQVPLQPESQSLPVAALPASLRELDLTGAALLPHKGTAKNVLIVTLEGIPGLYYPQIREALAVPAGTFEMQGLAENTSEAMLVPDFVTHSHQTIRGLYSLLCGDFSKLSYETPKAFELQGNKERAQECLPAQMAKNGWETHFLQGAGLSFMGKDQVMPTIGFQHVHGNEWFQENEPEQSDFIWGVTDPTFFRGARKYIAQLRAAHQPWMLTLLTVGTHQPYAAPEELVAKYKSRKTATVAILDEAVAGFLKGLKRDGVLEDTLVIITSDESHGAELAEWISSWGLAVILAPEHKELPRLKQGTFGLVDITASILDYLGLEIPPAIIGRSVFRDYAAPREMVSYTCAKLRWHTSQNLRYECSRDGECRVGRAPSLLGFPPAEFAPDRGSHARELFSLATTLDHTLTNPDQAQLLRFANGEIRKLPEKIVNEWTDNLTGAQYLDFPKNSKVHVSIRVKALQAPTSGIQLQLFLREHEILVSDIAYSPFPVLYAGEEGTVEFNFANARARQAFSFHLVGEGKDSAIQLEEFTVTVDRAGG